MAAREWMTSGRSYRESPTMPPKSCSWAQIGIKRPVARVATFVEFENMAPRSMSPMLTHRGVTSIKALCQALYPFKCLDLCNHTLYRLVAFRQMTYFFATITLVLSVYSSPTTTLQIFTTTTIDGLFSMKQLCFHHTTVYWVRNSSSIIIFVTFFPPLNAFQPPFPLMLPINFCRNLVLC